MEHSTFNQLLNLMVLNEKIIKRGDKYIVTNEAGTKILGTHDTRKKALKQLQAIEASKHS